jgi:ATP-binding cassette subfamily B protein
MDNGEIVEQGTHTNLMALKGVYFDLFEKQLLEEQTT